MPNAPETEELYDAIADCTTDHYGRSGLVWDVIRQASKEGFAKVAEKNRLSPNEVIAAAAASAGFDMAACFDHLREAYLESGEMPPDAAAFQAAFFRMAAQFFRQGMDEINSQKRRN